MKKSKNSKSTEIDQLKRSLWEVKRDVGSTAEEVSRLVNVTSLAGNEMNLWFLKKLFNIRTKQKQLEKNRELARKKSGTDREHRKKIGNKVFEN